MSAYLLSLILRIRENCYILLIDDNPYDQDLINEFIHNKLPDCKFERAHNGEHGLKILSNLYDSNQKLPSLIISDLNMPIMDGHETLNEIQKDERFSQIPIVIFTTSCYSKIPFDHTGIKVYTKPFSLMEYEKCVEEMLEII